MARKSWWESPFWIAIGALAGLVTIIGFLLQIIGGVDIYKSVIMPFINLLTFPVPLFSIPLTFLVIIAIIFLWAYLGEKRSPVSIDDPLARAEYLDDRFAREIALLCKTPRTIDFLRGKYREILAARGVYEAHSIEHYLKELEDRNLLNFQNGKWEVNKKALDYIAKYHGE
jgi:uncharacterized membrane protein